MNLVFLKKITLFTFLFCTAVAMNAQVQAPELICVKSDTLIWNIPSNGCGAFNSYIIYGSMSFNGPYSPIATITNNLQNSYFHDEADNDTWYYYMETDADCPGEIVLSSDTLDSNAPAASPILYADIENGKALLEWIASPSPEVIGYVIYRSTELGTIPIDTVDINTLTYCDPNSDPNAQAENYYVIGIDACGTTGLLENPHQTVFVSGEVSVCDQNISLNWNLYQGWAGIDRQEVWAAIDGDPPVLLQTLNGTDDSTFVPNLIDEANYCFFLESYDAITGGNSTSNEICLSVDILEKIKFLEMKNVSVTGNNGAVVSWQWNQDAELSDYSISSSPNNSDFQIVETLAPSNSLPLNNNYTDATASVDQGPVYYKINTTDQCGDMAESNIGVSIHLSGQASETLSNDLSWTPFLLDNASTLQYEVFRIGTNNIESAGIVDPATFSFSDSVDPSESSDAMLCYYVVATSNIILNNGTEESIRSQSNTVCIEQPTGILAPNAFAPAGINYEFRPILIFGEAAEYQMSIWDRWGQKIFETEDVLEGWTGRQGFRELPAAVYTYQISVKQMSGREVIKTGTVTLVR